MKVGRTGGLVLLLLLIQAPGRLPAQDGQARTGAAVLCVEADPYWLRYLEANVGGRTDIDVVAALLTADEQPNVPHPRPG